MKKPDVPIVVRTGKEGLTSLFEDICGAGGAFASLDSFPLLDRACSVDNITGGLNETIARAIHEDYVRIQKLAGVTEEKNHSIKPWERLDETLKLSNRNQAVHIREKLHSINCDIVGLTDWEQPLFTVRGPGDRAAGGERAPAFRGRTPAAGMDARAGKRRGKEEEPVPGPLCRSHGADQGPGPQCGTGTARRSGAGGPEDRATAEGRTVL